MKREKERLWLCDIPLIDKALRMLLHVAFTSLILPLDKDFISW